MTRIHHLKTWPEPYQAVADGRKRHEVRVDDRGFAVGDELVLKEWDPTPSYLSQVGYTGRELRARVLYLTSAGSWGLPANRCVMSIEVIEHTRRAP